MSFENKILVKLKDAGFRFNEKWLVQGVSLQVEKGKIVTLIGPNGSGKSTTAKIALGIYKKIEGEVEKYTNKIGTVGCNECHYRHSTLNEESEQCFGQL